jgi:alpha-1,2-mannosyltransferase
MIPSVRDWVPALRRVAASLVLLAAIVVAFLPLSRAYDVDVFLHAGQAALRGLPVYPVPGTAAVYSGFSFVYPYFVVWPFILLAALPPAIGIAVFFAVSAGALLAACVSTTSGPWRASLVLCTAFTITGLQLGAISPLLFAGTVFLWRARDRPGVFVLAAPVIASKLFLAPLLLWLLLSRRYRALAWAGASTIALLALGFLLGPIDPGRYLSILSQLGAHEAQSGFGVIGALMNAGFAMVAAQASALALTLAVLVAAYVRNRRAPGGDERVLFAAAVLASLLLTPVLWSHYLVLLLAVLLALDAPKRWFVVFALGSWAIAPPHGLDGSGVIQAVALAATLGCLLVLATPAVIRRAARRSAGAGSAAQISDQPSS